MKSATPTRHLRSSGRACMHVTDYIIWKYLFSILIGLFESRHFALNRYTFFMSVRQVYTEFRSLALKFTETETAESASCLLSVLYKTTMFCCYCECTQINSLYKFKRFITLVSKNEYFKSKWAHRRLHPSHSERYCSASTLHKDIWIEHISLG